MAEVRVERMPDGWMVDHQGRPLTDPARASEGFLLPIGGYKGYGLSLAIGLLAGVLNGARFGSQVIDIYQDDTTPTDTGQTVIALRPDLFRATEEFKLDAASALDELHLSATMRPGDRILVPGERAAEHERELREHGVPVVPSLAAPLGTLADECGVAAPFPVPSARK